MLALIAVLFTIAFVSNVYQESERRHDNCVNRQELHDAQIAFARFLGSEMGVSPQRIDVAVGHLQVSLGPRPHC